ncbi:SWI/SNF catalytic subunit SNF2 Ecym_6258 [Eremothecium cymbalariae DBVPG|uniref:Transcription regulatory protein SNF2 n=1 Tax=Eremothecium cymbalariae (strain CBS 270.75 / DBVPG 7215 / KCTC 17166 / NRRL Y-17582) TaxID=931890 RepID=G8JVG1_ERECY|nr:hypothetical protein Ecym_6258 [Eremothecium cymbalariae DBVPG\
MDMEIPQRQLTKEEINRCYLRWQQLRNQHGENASTIPEFIYFTRVLRQAAKQQQQQQQQQAQTPQQVPQPMERQGSSGGVSNGGISPGNSSGSASAGVGCMAFTQEQSELLKAQITALKCLAHKQPIPKEALQVVQVSLDSPPNLRQMVTAVTSILSRRQEQSGGSGETAETVSHGVPLPQQTSAAGAASKRSSGSLSPRSSVTPVGIVDQDAKFRMGSDAFAGAAVQHNQLPSAESQLPPKQQATRSLDEYRKAHPDIPKIVDITNPTMIVDSYSVPKVPNVVDYVDLFTSAKNPKLMIQPGILPMGMDVHSAMEVYQTLTALDIDTSVDDALNSLSDESLGETEKADALLQYYSLQLLPLQKAVRGHVLQFEWFQNTLLTNTHPNFLSKIRKVNIQDALLTNDLYKRHELQQDERQKFEKSAKLETIMEYSISWFNQRMDKRAARMKFSHRLITVHGNLEKDEQKRVERNAKQRLQALKSNDEEAYIKLLDQTKDTRITHLLKQTNAFLDSLTKAVKDQQKYTQEKIHSHLQDEESSSSSGSDDGKLNKLSSAVDVGDDERERIDYYEVAHKIKEDVKKQPSILVGGTLKEYQIKGLQWMVSLFNNHLNGILADEMGLGKTIQTISLLTYLYEVKGIRGPFLVVVPLSTLTNWNAEFDKWAPTLRKIAFKGPPSERKALTGIIKSGSFEVVLTTFEYIIKERPLLSKIKWVHMIIDEGHRMKNSQSKLSLTLNQFYHTDYRLILTGTPLQNNLPELWALLNFVLPKIFNSVKSFDEWFNTPFANTGGQDKIELSEEETLLVIRRLHKVLRPFLLRRLKKDVEKELPDKVEKVLKCRMSALQQKLYEQMLKHRRLFVVDEQSNKKMVGLRGFNNQIMQLKKICNHPFVFEQVEDQINPKRETNANIWRVSGKFELLEKILPKFKASGHRVLIFFQMTQIMDIMEDFLRFCDMKYLRLDGHTKSDDRTTLLNMFNAPDSEYFCFLLSTRAGGLGLNLQTADTVIIFDTDWNPHQDLQAQDRAHRIGQKNEVRILRLITDNSVEEVILERAHKKLDIDGKVIQAGKFDNKSTAEEQEALLRSLLEAEEDQKKRRELGIDEDEQLDDSELNEILARNDDELKLFAEIDAERNRKQLAEGITSRLMDKLELPDFYHQDIAAQIEKEKSERMFVGGRGTRDRKATHYGDSMSEEQWLKQFEVSDDDEDGIMRATDRAYTSGSNFSTIVDENYDPIIPMKRKQGPGRPPKFKKVRLDVDFEVDHLLPQTTADDPPIDGLVKDNPIKNDASQIGGKTSIKSVRVTKAKPKVRGRRGRPAKNGRNFLRDMPKKPLDERHEVSLKAKQLYDYILSYRNEEYRRLADIFLVRPSKKLYPDYYMLIKYPAALENVKRHIDTLAYDFLKEALEDFHLIFANARVYNTEGSVIYNDSIELEDAAVQKYKELSGDNNIEVDFSEFDSHYGTIVPFSQQNTQKSVNTSVTP